MPSDTGHSPEQRVLEQSMRLPPGGAVTGWAACRLYGANFFDGLAADRRTQFPVPLLVSRHCKVRVLPGSTLTYGEVSAADVRLRFGVPTVSLEWAAYDAMRLASDLREAVVAIDALAAARITSVRRVHAHAEQRALHRRAPRGHRQVLSALTLASEHSRSPNETRLRLICQLDAGLPALLANVPVYDRAGVVGVADLLEPRSGLVIEFDGADHRGARRQQRDAHKDARLRELGLEVLRVTGLDLVGDPRALVQRVTLAWRRAAAHDAGSWRAVPPADTLDAELDREEERAASFSPARTHR